MKSPLRRRALWLFAALLPVALYAVIAERNSWRPKTTYLSPQEMAARIHRIGVSDEPKLITLPVKPPARLAVAAYSPDRKWLAQALEVPRGKMGVDAYNFDTQIQLFEVSKKRLAHTFQNKDQLPAQLSFSSDGKTLYVLSIPTGNSCFQGWRFSDGKLALQLDLEGQFGRFKIAPNAKDVAFWDARDEHEIYLWDLATRKPKKLLRNPCDISNKDTFFHPNGMSDAVSFSEDSRSLVIYGDDTITLYRLK